MRLPEEEASAEVDLAPLIDCVFLLLIFFLVATQLSEFEEHLEFDIPRSEAVLQVKKEFEMEPVTLSDREVVSMVGGTYLLHDIRLKERVSRLAEEEGLEIELFINIHPEAEFGSVTYLVDVFKLLGFQNLELRTYGIDGTFKQQFQEVEAARSQQLLERNAGQ